MLSAKELMLLNYGVGKDSFESLDCKEIKPVNPKRNQSWIFFGRTDAETEAPIFWPPDPWNWLTGKDPDAGKDWGQEKKGQQRMRCLDGITDSMEKSLLLRKIEGRRRRDNRGWDGWITSLTRWTCLSKLQELVKEREAWCAAIHVRHNCVTELNWPDTILPTN